MEKFTALKYNEVSTKKISNFETSFMVEPLERGFGNTLGNAIRRVLLSSIPGVSSFATKIEGVHQEFQVIPNVVEDSVQLILNLKEIRFVYNKEIFKEGEVIKVTLKSPSGQVMAKDFDLPTGVEIVNIDQYIATTTKAGALNLELFLTSGRGFVSFEDNKTIAKNLEAKINSKITVGSLITTDSDFSPVVNVSYESVELNSSAATIEERLTINVKTDGSVEVKDAIAQAAFILMSHLEILSNVANIDKDIIFQEASLEEKSSTNNVVAIAQLDLSVRSYNCLKRANFETVEQLSKITKLELSHIKNLGKKSVDEILEKLEERGIVLEDGE